MPQSKTQYIYDPVNKVTHAYSGDGTYLGVASPDMDPTAIGGYSPHTDLKNYQNKSGTDWGKYIKDNLADLIPSAVTMAVPELRGASPLMNVLGKMGLSTAAGFGADWALNANNDKPKMQSLVDSVMNSVLGIGVPELVPGLGNVGFEIPGITRGTTVQRNNSGSSRTVMQSKTESGPVMAPGRPQPGIVLDAAGKPIIAPVPGPPEPTGRMDSSTLGTSSTANSGIGNTQIQREVGTPGFLGHLFDLIKSVNSTKELNAIGDPRLSAFKSALAGLGLNIGTDATVNRPQQ